MLNQIVQGSVTMVVGAVVMSLMGIYAAYRAGISKRAGEHITAVAVWLFGSMFTLAGSALVWTVVGGGF